MNLAEIRSLVLLESGRLDLEDKLIGNQTSNITLLDFYINAGSRYLDLAQKSVFSKGEFETDLLTGEHFKNIPNLRVPETIWIKDLGSDRRELDKKTVESLSLLYPNLKDSENSTPCYWAIGPVNKNATRYDSVSVLILPPNVRNSRIFIRGFFWSETLRGVTDFNYWSQNFPDLLSLATQRAIEAANRNTEGIRDYEGAIEAILTKIDEDETRIEIDNDEEFIL